MSQWHSTAPLTISDGAAFFADPLVAVTMVSPTSGSTVTSSQFDVQWAFSPGTQSTFRVRIFSDAGGTILEYDSGEVASPTLLHTVPSGSIASADDFWIRVDITTTDLQAGQSPLTDFTTAFAPVNNVTGLTVTPVSTGLPHFLLEWSEVVPSGSEVFVNYNLYRRKNLTDTWIRIAKLLTIGTLEYLDYVPEAQQAYDYSITWTALDTPDTLESIRSAVTDTIPAFSSLFVHDWQSPDNFVEIVHQDVNISEELQMTPVKVWSRQAPTFHIGDGQAATISVSATDAWHDNKAMWNDLISLLTRQRTDGAVFVVRHRGERYFVQGPSARRGDTRPTLFDERVELLEAHVNEAVA